MITLFLVACGYAAGSISAGILVARAMGLGDPREGGSGNPGATNLLRLGGRKAAAITLFVDALKGLIPVIIAKLLGLDDAAIAAVGLAAFIGHLYPVFFGFRGGKGIATGLGVMLAWSLPVGISVLLSWAAVAAVSRISSLAALVSFATAPVYLLLISQAPLLAIAAAVMAGLTAWRHRSNIKRIINGTESRIGKRA